MNAWDGILGDTIIGALFMYGHLNGERNLERLNRRVESRIIREVENKIDLDGYLVVDEQLFAFLPAGKDTFLLTISSSGVVHC